jgi:Protein of unknown function (DUF3631)/Domain of unknown function (DUF6371)
MVWPYHDEHGRLMGFACRYELRGGHKEFLTLTFCEAVDGTLAWRWEPFSVPRPLYGLDGLAARREAPVLVVEGEKTALTASLILPEYVVVTSPEGPTAAHQADWSHLAGRSVTIWRDHDGPGEGYAAEVAQLAVGIGAASVAHVSVPGAFPPRWDLGDYPPLGWDIPQLRELCLAAQPSYGRVLVSAKEVATIGGRVLTEGNNSDLDAVALSEDTRQLLQDQGLAKIRSSELIAMLCQLEGRPWSTWFGGEPIRPRQVAQLLGRFGIRPVSISLKHRSYKGYRKTQFDR